MTEWQNKVDRLAREARATLKQFTWTDDTAAFAGRVSVALEGRDIPADDLAEWHECCRRWGPRSRSALGCLLGFVRVAWGMPDMSTRSDSDRDGDDGWSVLAPLIHGSSVASRYCDDEGQALLAAMEAAPR